MDLKTSARGILIPLGLVFPLFFVLSGAIYHQRVPIYDSGGSLSAVPLPVSLVVCFAAIAVLGRYREASQTIKAVLFFLGAMAAASLAAGGVDLRKAILLLQFLMPACALVLGEMLGSAERMPGARAWLVLIPLFVTAQVVLGYVNDEGITVHHEMIFFSIYQHRQFVPVVFVAAFVVAMFGLWQDAAHRKWIIAGAAPVACYAALSLSMLAIGLLLFGVLLLLGRQPRSPPAWILLASAAAALALGFAFDKGLIGKGQPATAEKFSVLAPAQPPAANATAAGERRTAVPGASALKVPVNVERRLEDWTLYGRGIVESPRTIAVGHAKTMDRAVSTSAHNYYLDLVYNFGVAGLLPIAWLIVQTVRGLWRARAKVLEELPLLGLAFVVLFFIFADNNFKVTFRQPYPGVFAFFLWGLLLSALGGGAAQAAPRRGDAPWSGKIAV